MASSKTRVRDRARALTAEGILQDRLAGFVFARDTSPPDSDNFRFFKNKVEVVEHQIEAAKQERGGK